MCVVHNFCNAHLIDVKMQKVAGWDEDKKQINRLRALLVPTILKIADEDIVYWMHIRESDWREKSEQHQACRCSWKHLYTTSCFSLLFGPDVHSPCMLHLGRDVGFSIQWLTEAPARRGHSLCH